MGLIDDKKNIFTEIAALTSARDGLQLPNTSNSLSSINNVNEIVPFMLDMLTVLIGSEALKATTGELMTSFIREIEPELKVGLKTQFIDFNSDGSLPNTFTTTGYRVDAKTIDVFGKLKTDPSSDLGNLIYGNSSNNFDQAAYNAIASPNTDVSYANILINYDDSSDEFIIKGNSSANIGDFLDEYIDELVLIDEAEFISKVIDKLFGTVSSSQQKNVQQTLQEEKINRTIEKIIDEEEDIVINDSELKQLEAIAEQKANGVNKINVGCAILNTSLKVNDVETLVNNSLNNTDPLSVGNSYVSTLETSFNDTNNGNQYTENQQAAKDGFFKRLIKAIVQTLIESITITSQIRTLLLITTAFKNNDVPEIGNPVQDLLNKRKLADCLAKRVKTLINEFLFELVKKELLKIVIPVTRIILREKINQFIGILRSLVRI